MTFPAHSPAPSIAQRPRSGLLPIFAAALVAVLSMLAQPAAAQQQAPAAAQYSEEQIEAFASATLEVERLNAKWIPQIAEAQTPDETATRREQAMQEMRSAVRDEGLSVEEYNSIYELSQRDPEVMQTVEEHRASLQ